MKKAVSKVSEETEKKEKTSPMLQQYIDVKKQYSDYILLFRLGDFYEMFFEDALEISRVLELALTHRASAPMCGVPYHSSEVYIKRMIDKGYKVAICEQLTDPKAAKGLVQRGVIRLVTAGTVTEEAMLSESNNYIASIFADKETIGIAFADISTGEVHVYEKSGKNAEREVITELSGYTPVELLINSGFPDLKEAGKFVKERLNSSVELLSDEEFDNADLTVITEQFDAENDVLASGITLLVSAQKALCALFRYVSAAQKATVKRFVNLMIHDKAEYMGLSLTARRNLELCETMRSKEKRGSLFGVLDKTMTAMGRRRLHSWIVQPLVSHTKILERLDAVEDLLKNPSLLSDLRDKLHGIYDLERLLSRVMYRTASPRDIKALGQACLKLPSVKQTLGDLSSRKLIEINKEIKELNDVSSLVENAVVDEPPQTVKEGGVIKAGFNSELDRLRKLADGSKNILADIEARERERTGIRTLKVGYNRVFGYYIEVSKSFVEQVPADYVRKQTLTNGERYITDELHKIESEILGANDRILGLEQAIFSDVRDFIATKLAAIQETAGAISVLDALCSFAQVSLEYRYVKPEITMDRVIDIRDGRHPVIERILNDNTFTPNDVLLDGDKNRLLIITGPNMAGKSTYMRQNALIVLMAQMGCFVPASYAKIGVVDQIFTRVGASDDLTAGQSTFMVEMNEVAEILKNATKDSLVILDEIGRGTSTFDGLSIAKSTAEHIVRKIGCKTLFATHYHELITMESELDGVQNFSVAVSRRGDDIKFLHKIVRGGTDDSYGIEVAKLAGLPNSVIKRAKEELKEFEVSGKLRRAKFLEDGGDEQVSFAAVNEQNAIARLRAADINTLSPMDALLLLKDIKDTLD